MNFRAKSYKSHGKLTAQERRRKCMLERQKQKRNSKTNQARKMSSSCTTQCKSLPKSSDFRVKLDVKKSENLLIDTNIMDVNNAATNLSDMEFTSLGTESKRDTHTRNSIVEQRRRLASQFSLPDWLIDVPLDLGPEKWLVMPRAEGRRCMVVSENGSTKSFLLNGKLHKCFPSLLPGGSNHSRAASDRNRYCVLDCIFVEATRTYYVHDLLCWKGHILDECEAEFRLFWMKTKLVEEKDLFTTSKRNPFRFVPTPISPCSSSGLTDAYKGKLPDGFRRDGLVFIHKEGHYHSGITPLQLYWKDVETSRYFINTESDGSISRRQSIVLKANNDLTLKTSGGLVLGHFSLDQYSVGDLLRFSVSDVVCENPLDVATGEEIQNLHQIHIIEPKFEGKSNGGRAFADCWTKIWFKRSARRGVALSIHVIAKSIQSLEAIAVQ